MMHVLSTEATTHDFFAAPHIERDYHAALLVTLTRLAVTAPDVPGAVTPMLESLLLRTAAVGAAYFQVGGASFFARASAGDMPTGPAMAQLLAHGLPGNSPLMQALLRTSDPLFFDDTAAAPATAGFDRLGVQSLAASPVRAADDTLLGAFLMHTFEPHAWTVREADLFAAITGTLASVTARLVVEEQATQAREGALRALGLALECRDGETAGHTDRVTALALRLGETMRLSETEQTALRWGSYLHDIGKIGIPDAILRKPGPLNDAEWEVMRTHPVLGIAFAQQLGFLLPAACDVIQYHHERWDGLGYPRGLRGTDIPQVARIFAVCDTYDALTNARPYKPAWSHAEAIAEIQKEAGRRYDPAVVAALCRLSQERA